MSASKPIEPSSRNEASAVIGLYNLSNKMDTGGGQKDPQQPDTDAPRVTSTDHTASGSVETSCRTKNTMGEDPKNDPEAIMGVDEPKQKMNAISHTVIPRSNDILSGRGNGANQHTGNIYFRNLIASYKRKYVLSEPVIKKQITHQVLSVIESRNPPGRFLKQDAESGEWKELDRDTALRKTAQALREKAPLLKKKVLEEAERKDKLVERLKRKAVNLTPLGAEQNKKHHVSVSSLLRNGMNQASSSLNDPESSRQQGNAGDDRVSNESHFLLKQQLQRNGASHVQMPMPALFPNSMPPIVQAPGSQAPFNLVNPMNNSGLMLANDFLQHQNVGILSSSPLDSPDGINRLSFLGAHQQQSLAQGVVAGGLETKNNLTQQDRQTMKSSSSELAQSPADFMPFTFNYNDMTISLHSNRTFKEKKNSKEAKAKRKQEISKQKSAEMLENIIMIASTSVDLTALFLIVSMSARAFDSPQFAKQSVQPCNHDVIINAKNEPDHPGNIMLAEAVQTYRSDYLQSGYSNQLKNELAQLLFSGFSAKEKKKGDKPRFLIVEQVGHQNYYQNPNKAEWRVMQEKEIVTLIKSLFEQACSFILNPDPNDVLFGSDCRSQLSPGNIFFKSIIRRCKPLFMQSSPDKKTQYATEIVGFVTSRPGRFLGYIENMGMWIPLPFESAIDQTQQQLDDSSNDLVIEFQDYLPTFPKQNGTVALPPHHLIIHQDTGNNLMSPGVASMVPGMHPQNAGHIYGNPGVGNTGGLSITAAPGITGSIPQFAALNGQFQIDARNLSYA